MSQAAKMVILGANIVQMTAGQNQPAAEALAIEDGRVIAVGSDEEIGPLIGERTRTISLVGKSVLPGFIDTHVHFLQTGFGLREPNLSNCTLVDEVLEIVRSVVSDQERKVPVFFFRCRLASLDRPLTRWDLDRVAPANPVAVGDFEMHTCVVNSLGLDAMGIPAEVAGIEVEAEKEIPTGLLTRQAHITARSWFYNRLDESVRLDALRLASNAALRKGVTTVHAIGGRDAFGEHDMRVLVEQRGNIPVRLVLYCQTTNLDKALNAGATGVADIWADGNYSSRTAALSEPYADDPSTKGSLRWTQDDLSDFVLRAHSRGLQVGMHAIGDAAIEQVLNAYQCISELDKGFKQRRHRIEHFSLPTDSQVERAARLGVALAMQPALSAGPQQMVTRRLGVDRVSRRHPYRKIVDAGILVAGGSDSDFSPINPLIGIHVLVNSSEESRKLSVLEALSLFTINGAKIAAEEKLKGTIEPGKLADLVVLGDNPLTATASRLKDIPVEMTIVGGKIEFDARHEP